MPLLAYFAALAPGKMVLWCYLLWYLVNVAALFDPSPGIWLNSAGISLVIGFALLLSVSKPTAGGQRSSAEQWQTFRLFLMPFCVSSFATLIKGRGYVLVFPSNPHVLGLSLLVCAVFIAFCLLLRRVLGVMRVPRVLGRTGQGAVAAGGATGSAAEPGAPAERSPE